MQRLVSVPVLHCNQSYGVVLNLRNGCRVVYSGDCRPSESLVSAGRGCDLLIHEATFGDCRAADASKKKHCTTSEAAAVGRRMRARHTVLTHFSQRYASPSVSPVDTPTAPPSASPLSANATIPTVPTAPIAPTVPIAFSGGAYPEAYPAAPPPPPSTQWGSSPPSTTTAADYRTGLPVLLLPLPDGCFTCCHWLLC